MNFEKQNIMLQEIEQIREEKIAMYMKSTKKALASMLFESNKQLRDKPIEICNLADVSEPLIIENLTVHPIDKDGDFEIELDWDNYRYINRDQAKVLIKYIQDNLNAR